MWLQFATSVSETSSRVKSYLIKIELETDGGQCSILFPDQYL